MSISNVARGEETLRRWLVADWNGREVVEDARAYIQRKREKNGGSYPCYHADEILDVLEFLIEFYCEAKNLERDIDGLTCTRAYLSRRLSANGESAATRKPRARKTKNAAKTPPAARPSGSDSGSVSVKTPQPVRIAQFLRRHGQSASLAEIAATLGIGIASVASALTGLIARGEVERASRGRYRSAAESP